MANLFKAELGKLSPALGQLNRAGVTDEMWELIGNEDGVYARVVYEAMVAKMNGLATPSSSKSVDESEQNPNERHTAFVSYQLPTYDELNGTRFNWANHLFSSRYKWEEHESVRGLVDRTPGNRDFLVKEFTEKETEQMGGLTSDNVVAWAAANGYRAPLLEETVDFAKAHPDLQCKYPIIALGSFTLDGSYRTVAILGGNGAERRLGNGGFGSRWNEASCRFLLVRKQFSET